MTSSTSDMMIPGEMEFTYSDITDQSKRGIDLLMEWIAADALHNSDESLCDAPKRRLRYTRVQATVIEKLMKWVEKCEAQVDFMVRLLGPENAGKSVIAKRIAELAAEKGLLIGTFFFSATSSTRNIQDRLIPTLAYQMLASVPGTRNHVEDAIARDPAIFKKDLQTQIDTLLMRPLQSASMQNTQVPFPKLIIIDGLNECSDNLTQITILCAISRSITEHNLPVICLVASQPTITLDYAFSTKKPLKSHSRISLNAAHHSENDLRLFLSDKFEQIRCTHPLGSTISMPWPTEESLDMLVRKSDGQLIFAATVVRFVESIDHQPAARLNSVLGISPPDAPNPFIELDALYKHILSFVDDIQPTLRVLSLCASSPDLADWLSMNSMCEHFLSLEEGVTIKLALIDLSPIVSFDESSGEIMILDSSFVDFLGDKRRSDEYYIDMANARTDFACRTLQYVKGPDGIRAGDGILFDEGITTQGWIHTDQLKSDILKFDLDAFITATVNFPHTERTPSIIMIFYIWMSRVVGSPTVAKDFGDRYKQLLRRSRNCFEARIQKYQSHWRLQLLLTLAAVMDYAIPRNKDVTDCKYLDTLLEMDDDLHLVDRNALNLRHSAADFPDYTRELKDVTSRYVDGDQYASAALHCLRFLCNPPNYSETGSNDNPEKGITVHKWRTTCYMAFDILCVLLKRANASPGLMQFMSDHDIDATVQTNFRAVDVWRLNVHILAFLSRGGVCVNWRIVSAVKRATDALDQSASSEESDWDMREHSFDSLSESDLMQT